jgi:hypothetical protein
MRNPVGYLNAAALKSIQHGGFAIRIVDTQPTNTSNDILRPSRHRIEKN